MVAIQLGIGVDGLVTITVGNTTDATQSFVASRIQKKL